MQALLEVREDADRAEIRPVSDMPPVSRLPPHGGGGYDRPLPALVDELRRALYEQLVPIADEWAWRLDSGPPYPTTLDAMIDRCTDAGQTRPTPLVFRYVKDDFNTLHQDVYGDISFPLQAMSVLNRPNDDFTGGEFMLVTQVPRAQPVGEVVTPTQGQMVIFANSTRPMAGSRGWYRAKLRHDVSRVRSGTRHTLGVIFHDAR
jgi:hypothetical protein